MMAVLRDHAGMPRSSPIGPSRQPTTRPVMKQVADRAGVALSSVSRVLSGHPDVSAVMRNRVLDAVATLGYEPDRLAQSLRTGATMSVGVIVGDISNPLMAQIVLGAEMLLRDGGYSALLTNSGSDPRLDVEHLRLLQQRRVDGMLLSLSDEEDTGVAAAVGRLDVPAVLVDRQLSGQALAAALSDHSSGIQAAANELATLGHRRVGLVNGSPRVRPSRERATALRKVCRATNMQCRIRAAAYTAEHGYQATLDLMRVTDAPTALIAGGNQILVGVLRALRELALTVPCDVSLITCDDVPLASYLDPPIATISREPREIGRVAAELLLEQLHGGPVRSQTLPTTFTKTNSVRPPRNA